ncbi:fumarylacetoacetate hydrolase family protein [Streptomyces sp. M19]
MGTGTDGRDRPTRPPVSVDEALEYVAGYTIANDLTDRATVFRRDMPRIGTDWLRGKNAPGFTRSAPGWCPPSRS